MMSSFLNEKKMLQHIEQIKKIETLMPSIQIIYKYIQYKKNIAKYYGCFYAIQNVCIEELTSKLC